MNAQADTKPAQEVAHRRESPVAIVRRELDAMRDQFLAALPEHIPVERFLRIVMTAVQNNPELLECDRRSFFNACMRAAADGGVPDGRDGAIVVRFDPKIASKKSANWQIMIAGIRRKARNSGEIATWDVEEVRENDEFEFESGDTPFIRHKPALSNRGKLIACYSVCTLKSGEKTRCVMGIDDILAIRDQYSDGWKAYKAGRIKSTPWLTSEGEMSKKTVARRHSKTIPMSTDLEALIRRDDDPLPSAQRIEPPRDRPKSLGARLDALAGVAPEPEAQTDTETIIEHNSPPSPIDRGEEAAADRASSVEIGAGSSTTDPEGGSAPDPQKPASQQGPQEGVGLSRSPQAGPAPSDPMAGDKAWAAEMSAQIPAAAVGRREPEITSGRAPSSQATGAPAIPAKPLSDNDRAVVAALMAVGEAQARVGSAALREWLDGLPDGQRRLLPNVLVEEWIGIALARTKAPPAPPAEKAFPDDKARRARKADIEREGEARAQEGEAALRNFLDQLAEAGEGKIVSQTMITHWRGIAKAARR